MLDRQNISIPNINVNGNVFRVNFLLMQILLGMSQSCITTQYILNKWGLVEFWSLAVSAVDSCYLRPCQHVKITVTRTHTLGPGPQIVITFDSVSPAICKDSIRQGIRTLFKDRASNEQADHERWISPCMYLGLFNYTKTFHSWTRHRLLSLGRESIDLNFINFCPKLAETLIC